MEILKEISKDKLVIMVTHNPQLADEYSSRIIRLKDGSLVSDSNPFNEQEMNVDTSVLKRPGMSFKMACSLSLNNLMTKDTFNKLGYKTKINTHTTSCINLFLDIYLYSEYRLIYC